jgi:prephenate dehydrogenase
MPVQITIIGLGQTGASLGLALAAHKERVFVTGHDKEFSAERLAKQKGAVDATNHNLPASVENADLILLAIPVHQLRETFGFIAQDVKQDAVVIDLCPVKSEVANWAKELLPAHCHYVGLAPAIGPIISHLIRWIRVWTQPGLISSKKAFFSFQPLPGRPARQ